MSCLARPRVENGKLTIIPGDVECIISGLNWATSEIILGLSAKERGTFWYKGQGKLQNNRELLGNSPIGYTNRL